MPKKNKIIVKKKNSIKKGNYYLEETIGEGAFAKVKLGTHIPTGEKVAIKILNKEHLFDESNDIQKIKKEINILKRIKHKNIIQLYEIMESKSNLYIVMEYCENKELFDYIISKKYLKEKEACRFFQQIIDGVEYLHLSNITHRDLKPENLLLDKNYRIKISDFGLSYLGKNIDSLIETPCGTPSYAPPEMLKGEKYNGVFSDIWSCGIILYTMLVGNLPCAESKEELIYENIMKHNYFFPDYISEEVIDLIENMLKINPKERFNFEQIKAHPWFNKIKPKLKPGIVYGIHKIPIDNNILERIEKYGYNKEKCMKSILNNNFDENCSIYYLTLKQLIREKKASISDLFSDEYIKYLKDYKNWIKKDEINNPLFTNYQAEIPSEIEQEKEKQLNSDSLLVYNNKDINNNMNCPLKEEKNENSEKIILIKENDKNKKKENKNSAKTIFTSQVEKNLKKKKIRKNISNGEMNYYKIKNIRDIIKERLINTKGNTNNNKEVKNKFEFILTKRNNENKLDKSEFKNEISNNKNSFINKSAKTRKKKIILNFLENNDKFKKEKKKEKEVKYNKINITQNKIRNNTIIKKESLNKLNKYIDISKIESPREESESISFNSKMIISPKAFSSLSNDISEISKTIDYSYNKNKTFIKKIKEKDNIILDKLKEEEKIKLRNKLEKDEKKFMNDINIINNITADTTLASIKEDNNDNNKGKNVNIIYLMAKKLLKHSIFAKYLIKNKKKKNIIKTDLENKFFILQKYKNIIGLIENLKKKIFKKKYIDFNYQTFDEYLNDEDDRTFSQSFINIKDFQLFINKAKYSLYKKEKQKKRASSKASNLNIFKFNKIYNTNLLREKYVTEKKDFKKIKNIAHYNPKKKLYLSNLNLEESNNKIKKIKKRTRKINSSITSNDESIKSSISYDKNFFSSENTRDKDLNKIYKFNSKNINHTLEYDSDISYTSNNNAQILNKNNSDSINKDIIKKEESFSSNKSYNNIIEENNIYKKNKNIKTPQLGSKINNDKYNQNEYYEKEQYIIDKMPLIVNMKNKKKEISVKDKEKLEKNVWKLSQKKIKVINNENNRRNIFYKNIDINQNKTNMTFSGKNKYEKYIKLKDNIPIDLNCIINLPLDLIKSKIKSHFKKLGFFYIEKNNDLKVKKGNSNIEINIYKLDEGKNNIFYLCTKIKSNEMKKIKENIRKILLILNFNKKI